MTRHPVYTKASPVLVKNAAGEILRAEAPHTATEWHYQRCKYCHESRDSADHLCGEMLEEMQALLAMAEADSPVYPFQVWIASGSGKLHSVFSTDNYQFARSSLVRRLESNCKTKTPKGEVIDTYQPYSGQIEYGGMVIFGASRLELPDGRVEVQVDKDLITKAKALPGSNPRRQIGQVKR